MPPKAHRDAGQRVTASPSASLHSSGSDSPTLPGDALLDDNSIPSPGVPSTVDALVMEPGLGTDDLTFSIMQWLLASATAEADDASHCWLDARDARDRAASQELLLESERRRVLASLRGAGAARRAEDAAAFARGAATRAAASAAAEEIGRAHV